MSLIAGCQLLYSATLRSCRALCLESLVALHGGKGTMQALLGPSKKALWVVRPCGLCAGGRSQLSPPKWLWLKSPDQALELAANITSGGSELIGVQIEVALYKAGC